MFRQIGPTEIIVIVVLLFGAKKLPELARGGGRALRIFKAETKGLIDDDEDKPAIDSPRSTSEAEPVTDTERRPEDR